MSRAFAKHTSDLAFLDAVLDSCVDFFTITGQSRSTTAAPKTVPAAPRPARRLDCLPGGPFASSAGNDRDNRRPAA
jgi:hypothetical protein